VFKRLCGQVGSHLQRSLLTGKQIRKKKHFAGVPTTATFDELKYTASQRKAHAILE
jgi:hypothetical protein